MFPRNRRSIVVGQPMPRCGEDCNSTVLWKPNLPTPTAHTYPLKRLQTATRARRFGPPFNTIYYNNTIATGQLNVKKLSSPLSRPRHRVYQHSHPLDLDLDPVAFTQEDRRLSYESDALRRSGEDQSARQERELMREVADQFSA